MWSGRNAATRSIDRAVSLNLAAMCAVVVIYIVTVVVGIRGIDNDLSRGAVETVERWYDVGFGDGVDMARLLDARGIAADGERNELHLAGAVGNLRGFEIYLPDGRLARPAAGAAGRRGADDAARLALAQRALATGAVHTRVEHFDARRPEAGGRGATHDLYLPDHGFEMVQVEVYKPVRLADGRTAAVMALVDVSEPHLVAKKKLNGFIVLDSALAGLALIFTAATAWLLHRQRHADRRIHHLAHFDTLTGVANRSRFNREAPLLLDACARKRGLAAVYMVDLDRFKSINDQLGHGDGDVLLTMVAGRLEACCPGMLIARLGGDEFVVLQTFVASEAAAAAQGERIAAAIRTIDIVASIPVAVSASVGCVAAPATASLSDMLRQADAALYAAKRAGRDQAVLFRDGMDETIRQHAAVRYLLREAVRTKGFELFFQPLHSSDGGRLTSFEALLRLPDGEGGYLSPDHFIPIAEEMAIISEVGTWVLGEACRVAATWPPGMSVAINLSPQEFETGCIVDRVRTALAASGLAAERLEIEVTENLFIADPEAVGDKLHRLRELGVRVVMDDFGTGYSSLQNLWRFPFDKLKVDRSCFMSLGESESVPLILRTIRAMTHAMRLRVTAEGIETEAQKAFAEAAGYDELQGYLYSRPIPAGQVADYIAERAGEGAGKAKVRALPAPPRALPCPEARPADAA
ncbi:MAG: hypothetical protein AcusKO_04220 [Acuticoccus sp.]